MAATQQEIADRLNISRSLVARALSSPVDTRVSGATRSRVIEAARELGYSPNDAARSLSTGKSYAVSFVYLNNPTLHNGQVHSGAMQTCAQELSQIGYGLKINIFNRFSDSTTGLQKIAASRACDAIVLWGKEEDVEPHGELLAGLGVPFVVKGRHEVAHPDWYQIDFDHEGIMALATRHLWDIGHRRIAYIGYRVPDRFAQQLLRGYSDTIEQLSGADPDARLIGAVEGDTASPSLVAQRWFELDPEQRPTALVVGSGSQTWQAVELELAKRGVVLGDGPGQFAVAGIGMPQQTTFFGHGYYFSSTELETLGTAMVHHLLLPILDGREPERRVVRLSLEMHLTESHSLQEIFPLHGLGIPKEKNDATRIYPH